MHSYVQLEDTSLGGVRGHQRRVSAVCFSALGAGTVVVWLSVLFLSQKPERVQTTGIENLAVLPSNSYLSQRPSAIMPGMTKGMQQSSFPSFLAGFRPSGQYIQQGGFFQPPQINRGAWQRIGAEAETEAKEESAVDAKANEEEAASATDGADTDAEAEQAAQEKAREEENQKEFDAYVAAKTKEMQAEAMEKGKKQEARNAIVNDPVRKKQQLAQMTAQLASNKLAGGKFKAKRQNLKREIEKVRKQLQQFEGPPPETARIALEPAPVLTPPEPTEPPNWDEDEMAWYKFPPPGVEDVETPAKEAEVPAR